MFELFQSPLFNLILLVLCLELTTCMLSRTATDVEKNISKNVVLRGEKSYATEA